MSWLIATAAAASTSTGTRSRVYAERIIPEVPRLRTRRNAGLWRHPLAVYTLFVSVSLVLLGSMAVASLPM